MTAARHASGNPGPGARKTARWLILTLALVVVVPAALAGIIDILVTGTVAEAAGLTGLTALAALGVALVCRDGDQAFWAWLMAGIVLSAAGQILGSLAEGHGRPTAQAHTMSLLGPGLRAAGITCTCLAVAYYATCPGCAAGQPPGRSRPAGCWPPASKVICWPKVRIVIAPCLVI